MARFVAALAAVDAAGRIIDKAGEIIANVQDLLSSGNGRHTLTVGVPSEGDQLLYKEGRRAGPTLTYAIYDFKYRGDKKITSIVAEDHWSDDTGGDAEVVEGGIGEKHVTVRVTSQLLRGFDFTIFVFGKK